MAEIKFDGDREEANCLGMPAWITFKFSSPPNYNAASVTVRQQLESGPDENAYEMTRTHKAATLIGRHRDPIDAKRLTGVLKFDFTVTGQSRRAGVGQNRALSVVRLHGGWVRPTPDGDGPTMPSI
jgi:hypothetical protein